MLKQALTCCNRSCDASDEANLHRRGGQKLTSDLCGPPRADRDGKRVQDAISRDAIRDERLLQGKFCSLKCLNAPSCLLRPVQSRSKAPRVYFLQTREARQSSTSCPRLDKRALSCSIIFRSRRRCRSDACTRRGSVCLLARASSHLNEGQSRKLRTGPAASCGTTAAAEIFTPTAAGGGGATRRHRWITTFAARGSPRAPLTLSRASAPRKFTSRTFPQLRVSASCGSGSRGSFTFIKRRFLFIQPRSRARSARGTAQPPFGSVALLRTTLRQTCPPA